MNSGSARNHITATARLAAMLMLALVAVAANVAPAQANQVAIIVNGSAITSGDVNRRVKLLQLQRERGDLKKKAQDQLIEEAIKMNEVRRLRAGVSDAQVNQSFARFASANRMSAKQMSQMLGQAGVGARHFKEFIRVQMSWPRVVNARFSTSGRMSTEDLVAKMLERGGEKPTTTEYILQQVIFVVPQSRRNAILGQRKREAEAMRGRFVDCNSTRQFAKGLKDVSVRDLGRIMQPALPGEWKELVEKTQQGRTTKTRVTDRGVEFIAVCTARQVSDDLAAEMVFRAEQASEDPSQSQNSQKYLKELRERARITYN